MSETPQKRDEVGVFLATVLKHYGRAFTPEVLQLYWNGLSRYSMEEIRSAVSAHMVDPDEGRFCPSLAHIIGRIERFSGNAALANAAWSKVLKALSRVGRYRTVVFDDPRIHAVIEDMGGWSRFMDCDAASVPFRAKEFVERYSEHARSEVLGAYPAKLVGIARHAGPPVLIGDQERARHVLQSGHQRQALSYTSSAPQAAANVLPMPERGQPGGAR